MNSTATKSNLEQGLTLLRTWLQDAIEVEHATIPPYFTAWLSIKEGTNQEASNIIKSVMLEEMLHLTLAANLLNAVKGHPDLVHQKFVPRYPHKLPHSSGWFEIHIEKFSKAALETFMNIERPAPKNTKAKAAGFNSIDQFYEAVGELIDDLCRDHGEENVFKGDISLQIQPEDFYGSGDIVVVHNRETAHQAITTIVDQGEGADHGLFDDDHQIFGKGGGKELAHYYRFREIYLGKYYKKNDTPKTKIPGGPVLKVDYDSVYPIKKDINRYDYPKGTEIRKALDDFAVCYGELLRALHNAFNGQPSQMTEAMARMFSLRNQAVALMRTPLEKGKTIGLDFTQHK